MPGALPEPAPTRRAILALGALAFAPHAAKAHGDLGPVTPPRAVPPLPLTLHDGRPAMLPGLLQGRITALQLMFTGCSATCPLQGAAFAALQSLVVGPLARAQLLSLSIDPLADDAPALAAWRKRFGAGPAWLAAAPPVRHADAMLDFAGGRAAASRGGDRHNTQVFLFDAQGRLAYRCAEFASPRDLAAAMQGLARQA
jgi:protein SCO1